MTEVAIIYTGPGKVCSRVGTSTGTEYTFFRDEYGKPITAFVAGEDAGALLEERVNKCASHPDGRKQFFLLEEWEAITRKES